MNKIDSHFLIYQHQTVVINKNNIKNSYIELKITIQLQLLYIVAFGIIFSIFVRIFTLKFFYANYRKPSHFSGKISQKSIYLLKEYD